VTRVVVDASVLVAAALADGSTRRTLFSLQNLDLYVPSFIDIELQKQVRRIATRSGTSREIVQALVHGLLARVTIVPREGCASTLDLARQLVKRAGAEGDEDYVALALRLGAPIWTYDLDFQRVVGVRTVSRQAVERLDAQSR